MFPWFRKRIINPAVPFSLENQVELSYENSLEYRLEGKYLYGQFAGYPAVDEARGFAMREQPDLAAEALFEHFRDRRSPVLFLHNSEMALVRARLASFPYVSRSLLEPSSMALRHVFPIYGTDKFHTFGRSIDWLYNFRDDSWPRIPVRELRELLSEGNVDMLKESALRDAPPLEPTWHLNAHFHLTMLAKAFWISGNDNFASEALIQMTEWGQGNPIWISVNWLNFSNVAIRLMNWMLTLNMCMGSKFFTPEIFVKIMKVLILHGAVLAWHLRNDSTLSLEAVSCLYMFSANFPELKLSRLWHKLAESKFPTVINREFGASGFHVSGSLSGHCAALEWILLPLVQHIHNHSTPPSFLEDACRSSLDATQAICGTSRVVPDLGLSHVPGFLGQQFSLSDYTRNLLCLGALAMQHSEWSYGVSTMPGELIWWLGPEAQSQFEGLELYCPETLNSYFVANGLGVARDRWEDKSSQIIIKGCSPVDHRQEIYSPPNFPSPDPGAHCDFLSVILTIEDEPFLIEPGSSSSFSGSYPYLNSFFAHSTVTLKDEVEPFKVAYLEDFSESARKIAYAGGIDEVTVADKTLCSPLYMHKQGSDTFFEAQRQARLLSGITLAVTRELLFRPNDQMLIIRDSVSGGPEGASVRFENSLLFAPHLKLIMRGDMGCMVRGKKLNARVTPIFPKGSRHVRAKGLSRPSPTGWYYNYGMCPTNQIRYFSKMELPQKVYFLISWGRQDPPRLRSVDLDLLFKQIKARN
ncbi:MAG: heparinase II/III family protein [bacterium]|nr:heparinase II/III family protein [bacterium]